MHPKLRGLLALLGLAAIVIGMPALLIAAAPIGAISITWTPEGILRALTTPDNGTLALALFKAVGWTAWAILTTTVLLELVGILRRTPVPRLPGFAMPQLLARQLVASAAALFIATTTLTTSGLSAAPAAHAAGAPQAPVPAQTLPAHGQGARVSETNKPRTYTVKKGDTLSQIALDKTGRAANYPKLFRASTRTVQPGGRRLTDPDEIDIGWKITIPATLDKAVKPAKDDQRTPATAAPRPEPTPTASPRRSTPAPTQATATTEQEAVTDATPAASDTDQVDAPPAWLLNGLTGAGALLSGALGLVLIRRRAAQFRSRRPGRMITLPAAENVRVEQTVIREGSPTGSLVLFIDEALRRTASSLAAARQPVPALIGVDAHPDHLTLRLTSPADLGPVWTCLDAEARQIWRIPTGTDLELIGPLAADGAPPWPQLVTLGKDAAGWRLVNLETIAVASLTGDPLYCQDLIRYLVTELAFAPWARDVDIDCLQLCDELPALAPSRIHHHSDPAVITDRVATAVATTDRLTVASPATMETARVTNPDEDLWDSRLLISATTDAEHLDVLTRLLTEQRGRTGTALLLVAPDQPPTGTEIHLTQSGRVQVPALGLNLVANGLTEDESRGCLALMAAGRDLADTPMPVVDDPDREDWAQFCDEAGAVRADLTIPRASGPAGAASLLPEPDDAYVTVSANTVEDLAELTPTVPAAVAERIEASDPTLDDDLEDWWSSSCQRPRLQVLGTVKVRVGTTGVPTAALDRMPSCTEAVAYLHSRPGGSTTQEVADALGISDDRVRKDMSIARAWLGKNPATDAPFLPAASRHPAAIERGVGLYLIEDLLCDADLFKRLRLRGQSRGPDGLQDLRTALRLVNGAPYDGLRSRGGFWLKNNPLDQYLLCSIVDVAHLVSTIALDAGDLEQAKAAAELAVLCAPTDANPQLDLAAIAAKAGDHAKAAQIARNVVTWRDTAGEPVDLSERNQAILRTHRWLERASQTG
jgi:hypothetical protein